MNISVKIQIKNIHTLPATYVPEHWPGNILYTCLLYTIGKKREHASIEHGPSTESDR